MSSYNLIVDPEFKRLLPELRPEEYERLEESILAEGCRDPVVVWEKTIVDGHHRYEICQKHHLDFKIEYVTFSRREEAIRWICLNQIGRRNISPELLRYQIGKRYNMEKILTAHNPRGRNQYTEVASDNMMRPPSEARLGRAATIGKEYNVSHFAVHRYKEIAKAIDSIAAKDERLSERYLSGQIRIKKDDLDTIAELSRSQTRALTNSLIRQKKTVCHSQDILEALGTARDYDKENMASRERKRAATMSPQPSVKDMPVFDPDSEVASLSLTIPTWNTSIDRVFNSTDHHGISDRARTQLKTALLALRDSVDLVLLAIEEVENNE